MIRFELPYRAPMDWQATLDFLRRRAPNGVEYVGENRYARTVQIDGALGYLEVTCVAHTDRLSVFLTDSLRAHRHAIGLRLRRLFDLDLDPRLMHAALGRTDEFAERVARAPGLRIPGAWDGFEIGLRAIVGQQVSVKRATTFMGRLVTTFGLKLKHTETPPGMDDAYLFPTARHIAEGDVQAIGLTGNRARTVRSLAEAIADGELNLDPTERSGPVIETLMSLPGIGRWTAEYIAMRALRVTDIFLAGDLVIRKTLARGGELPRESELRTLSEAWAPYQAYAVLYLWSVKT